MKYKKLDINKNYDFIVNYTDKNTNYQLKTGVNFKTMLEKAIRLVLDDYKVVYTNQEINDFIDVFVISYDGKITYTLVKKFTNIFNTILVDFMKQSKIISSRNDNTIINTILFETFIKFQLESILIGYIYGQEKWQFLGYFAMMLRKKVQCVVDGRELVVCNIKDMLKIDLIISNNGKTANIAIPNTQENIENAINSICNKGEEYLIEKVSSNCGIVPYKNDDIIKYSKSLTMLNMYAKPKEVIALDELLNVEIDELILKVKEKDYEFYEDKTFNDILSESSEYENADDLLKNGFAELSTGVLKCNWLADN